MFCQDHMNMPVQSNCWGYYADYLLVDARSQAPGIISFFLFAEKHKLYKKNKV